MSNIEGKAVVITGTSSGLGEAAAPRIGWNTAGMNNTLAKRTDE